MKMLILFSALLLSISTHVRAADTPTVYPEGPANLIPAAQIDDVGIWVGGDVARSLFDGLTAAKEKHSGSMHAKIGINLACLHDSDNKDVEYSCVIAVKKATGAAQPH